MSGCRRQANVWMITLLLTEAGAGVVAFGEVSLIGSPEVELGLVPVKTQIWLVFSVPAFTFSANWSCRDPCCTTACNISKARHRPPQIDWAPGSAANGTPSHDSPSRPPQAG